MDNSGVKILVIEDEPDLRQLYVEVLKNAGYTVEIARDGDEGYAFIRDKKYDLVLLDLIMPKMSGVEILDNIKKFASATPINAIVIVSNVTDESRIGDSVELGVRGYMVKSDTTPDTLLTRIRDLLSTSPTPQD